MSVTDEIGPLLDELAEEREKAEAAERVAAEKRAKLAERLRRAESPADAEEIRKEWRELDGPGAAIGDFVMRLLDGSTVRVEVQSTHHNGLQVVACYEDPQ